VLLCKLGPHRVPEAGSRLDVAIELESVHVFDAETELRLTA
jgi:multiple sugar transport system ATP-binding protein